ncbi:MAG TPA: ABC transporter ATP-binding protein [Candidatus Nanoarchaeia archaeon]|nr:ABC transporter ATP-binding protein [Candidatus Nanoarchaeia archaeon]
MEVLSLKDVWKIYKLGEVNVEAARGVNMSIKKGEFVAIMGPSGSGKSTIMHLIGCLDKPTKGSIYLSNEDVSNFSEDKLAKIRGKNIGFVFQTFNLIQSLNALENVSLPLMFQGVNTYEREKKAKELLELVGLGKRLKNKPSQMSGGERQRVAIARALVNDPEIILADEPTGNLDSKTGHDILEIFKNLHKTKKKTIILVTHDDNVAKNAQRIIRFMDGRIAE